MSRPDDGTARTALAVVGIGAALALLWCWPVLRDPGHLALGDARQDLPALLWTLWWGAQPDGSSLVAHPLGDVGFYVLTPINLAIAELLGGAPVPAHNLSAALAVGVAAVGGGVLGHRLGGRPGALVGAFGLGLSPALGTALRDGIGEFTWIGLLALSLWAFARLGERSSRARTLGRMLAAAGLLALTALSCWYYGLAAGLGAGLMALASPDRHRRLPQVVAAGSLAVLLTLPAAAAFQDSALEPPRARADDLRSHLLEGSGRPPADEAVLVHDLPARTKLVGQADSRQLPWTVGLLGLAALGIATAPRRAGPLLAAGAVGLVLSLGSVTPGGLALPMRYLNRALTWFGSPMHLPVHFGALTTCVAVALAARGAGARPRLAGVGVALLLLSVLLPGRPLPLPTLDATPSEALSRLRATHGAVLDLPSVLGDTQADLDGEALRQLAHHRPIPRFPVYPTSEVFTAGLELARRTELARAATAALRGRDAVPVPRLEDLHDLDYGWVVLDRQAAPGLRTSLVRWMGPPTSEDERYSVFSVDGVPGGAAAEAAAEAAAD